ncbi:hypothetical protein [Catellicoccus marimammalium]|uniref:PXO2-10 n=1 Tax=Catellicoccus marimammalium M35/04/3 TaxID=1234409 RepID=K8ZNN4_9ENTE|nr:hypothetical protein [Catellicoccus marimammalium]EKU27206.1 pXO2-10 [Catellicoccus marimammalium M35/04/3]
MKVRNVKVKKKRIKRGEHSIYEIVPFKCRNENGNVMMKDGSYLGFLKVIPQSLNSMNMFERERAMETFNRLERIYDEDHSILSLRFPPNIEEPLSYWNRMLNEARNHHDLPRIQSCQRQIKRMYDVSKKLPNQEFFFMVYAESENELQERKVQLQALGGKVLSLQPVSKEEVDKLLFQLMNMNTVIN